MYFLSLSLYTHFTALDAVVVFPSQIVSAHAPGGFTQIVFLFFKFFFFVLFSIFSPALFFYIHWLINNYNPSSFQSAATGLVRLSHSSPIHKFLATRLLLTHEPVKSSRYIRNRDLSSCYCCCCCSWALYFASIVRNWPRGLNHLTRITQSVSNHDDGHKYPRRRRHRREIYRRGG